ncbi:MAG: HD domain-containing protein [Phycisphaerae bacterium]|nr:HD domain-containing protein [Phycisphaerae bacterium]
MPGGDGGTYPAILGATSDQVWDLQGPPQELLAAIWKEVERTWDNRPEYSVLCVDDDLEFLASLRRLLVPAAQHPFRQFTLDFHVTSSPMEALASAGQMASPLAVVVCDQVMPQMQGMDLLHRLKETHPAAKRVLLTGYAGIESAIRAVNEQLLDKYLTKPVENPTEFVAVIKDLAHQYHLRSLAAQHRRRVMAQFEYIQAMTGAENLEAALDTTTGFLVRQLTAPWSALFLYEEGRFVLRAKSGHPPQPPAAMTRAWRDYVRNCQAFQRRLPEAILAWGASDMDLDNVPTVPAAAVVPLTVRHDLLGSVLVGTSPGAQPMGRDDFLLTTFVTDIAATTVARFQDREALESTYVGTMASLMDIVEAKDSYTRGHTDRVVTLALGLARAAGIAEERLKDLRYAAALHDLGKLAVPETVLQKPGRLNSRERAIIMEHPLRADAILKHLRFLDAARLMIRSHHERFDGTGYPSGMAGEEIPLGARVLAIVDAYDAMTSNRPYRRAMTPEQALAEIRACAGTQFDPALASLFVEMMQAGELLQHTLAQGSPSESAEV